MNCRYLKTKHGKLIKDTNKSIFKILLEIEHNKPKK